MVDEALGIAVLDGRTVEDVQGSQMYGVASISMPCQGSVGGGITGAVGGDTAYCAWATGVAPTKIAATSNSIRPVIRRD